MSIEGLGEKFREARLARKLSLEEAARLTKIRPSRLAEIEADDFSNFPSLAYAKGFLVIYGKFLEVDVSSYLDVFETSNAVTVDGYSYLQDNPAPAQAQPIIRAPRNRTSLLPLVIGVVVLVAGFSLIKLIVDISRIAPPRKDVGAQTSPSSTATSPLIVAPRALPVDNSANSLNNSVAKTSSSTALETAISSPIAASAAQPEVRRAEPVHPDDLARAGLEGARDATGSATVNRVEIRPLKKTFIKVVVDNDKSKPAFERWISPNDGPVQFEGQHFAVRVLDPDAVQIRKNGKRISEDDADVTIE